MPFSKVGLRNPASETGCSIPRSSCPNFCPHVKLQTAQKADIPADFEPKQFRPGLLARPLFNSGAENCIVAFEVQAKVSSVHFARASPLSQLAITALQQIF